MASLTSIRSTTWLLFVASHQCILCSFGPVLGVRPLQVNVSLLEVPGCALPPCEADSSEQDGKESPDQPKDAQVADVKEQPSEQTRSFCMLVPMFMAAVAAVVPMHLIEKDDDGPEPGDHNFELEEGFSYMSYKDDALERQWQHHSHAENIKMGSTTLAVFAFLKLLYNVRRGIQGSGAGCYYYGGHTQWAFEVCYLFGVALASLRSLHMKSEIFYYGLLLPFTVYVLLSSGPPLRVTCRTLFEMCSAERPFAIAAFDCGPQGITQISQVVALILLLPLLIPKVNMMHYSWLGFLCYLAWSLGMRYTMVSDGRYIYSPCFVLCSFAVLCIGILMSIVKKKQLERARRSGFEFDLKRREATEQMYGILAYMMPRHIVHDLIMYPDTPIAIPVERISILFIVIADFDNFTTKLGPKHLLEFLNKQFSAMDAICDANRVTKVETVGEEYVACVGVIPEDVEEARTAGHNKACERLFKAAGEILWLQTDEVKYKMGMHTGKIIAGVIGMKHLPRFRLFGDTINTSARLMQKGEKGQLQFGEETHKELPLDAISQCESMREVTLKGKGAVKAWLFPKAGVPARRGISEAAETPQREVRAPITKIKTHRCIPKALSGMSFGTRVKAATLPEAEAKAETEAEAEAGDSFANAKHLNDSQRELFDEIFHELMSPEQMVSMSSEEEERWELAFHKQTFVKGLVSRLNWQAFLLAVLTGFEIIFQEATHAWEYEYYLPQVKEAFPGDWRMPLFLACRIILFLLLMSWIFAAQVKGLVEEHPKVVHMVMMVSICIGGCCLLISYDVLTDRPVHDKRFDIFTDRPLYENTAPFNLNFKPLFVIIFYEMATTNVPHFYPFVVVAVFSCLALTLFAHAEQADEGQEFMIKNARDLFAMNMVLAAFLTWKRTRSTKKRIHSQIGISSYEKRISGILNTLMPPLVVERLRDGLPSVHSYSKATIAQSDLCGFTELSSTKKPEEVVRFMSDLFGKFDTLTDHFEVYKVETIGDAYIAGRAEKPLTHKSDPLDVLLFGLAMIKATAEWAADLGVNVTCRVGVHHGSCVGGVVGTEMQRYHLFGKLMVQLDTLEATSIPAVAQVSAACKKVIEEELEATRRQATFGTFEERTEEFLQTSKGEKHTFDEVDGRTFLVRPFTQ